MHKYISKLPYKKKKKKRGGGMLRCTILTIISIAENNKLAAACQVVNSHFQSYSDKHHKSEMTTRIENQRVCSDKQDN